MVVVCHVPPLLWNFGVTCQVRLCCLACLAVLSCCVALLLCCKSHSALGLAWKTRHLRLVLRRREEGCLHDGGIDAIINITDGRSLYHYHNYHHCRCENHCWRLSSSSSSSGDVPSICSQRELSTHTLTVVGTRSRFALLRGKLPQLQSQFRASTCFFHQPRVNRSLTNITTTTTTEVACTRTSHHHHHHAFLLHPQHSARASIPLALQIHRHPAARMRFRPRVRSRRRLVLRSARAVQRSIEGTRAD